MCMTSMWILLTWPTEWVFELEQDCSEGWHRYVSLEWQIVPYINVPVEFFRSLIRSDQGHLTELVSTQLRMNWTSSVRCDSRVPGCTEKFLQERTILSYYTPSLPQHFLDRTCNGLETIQGVAEIFGDFYFSCMCLRFGFCVRRVLACSP